MDKKWRKIAIGFVTVSLFSILLVTVYNVGTKEKIPATLQISVPTWNNEVLKIEDPQEETQQEEELELQETTISQNDDSTTTTDEAQVSQQNINTNTTPQVNATSQETPNTEAPAEAVSTVLVEIVGVDGTMAKGSVTLESGDTAYTVLSRLASQQGISVSTTGWGAYVYVSAIGGIAERDYGPLSGWYYKVSGVKPTVGAGSYTVSKDDTIVWHYEKE